MKTKKILQPKRTTWFREGCLFSRHDFRTGVNDPRLEGRVTTEFYSADLEFMPTDSGMKTKKKGLRHEISGFVIVFTRALF